MIEFELKIILKKEGRVGKKNEKKNAIDICFKFLRSELSQTCEILFIVSSIGYY